jgi:hypothetical protein
LRKIKEKVRGEDRPKKAYLEKDNIFLFPFFEILAFSARHYLVFLCQSGVFSLAMAELSSSDDMSGRKNPEGV